MIQVTRFVDDVFFFWPAAGLCLAHRLPGWMPWEPAVTLSIGWGRWGLNVHWFRTPNAAAEARCKASPPAGCSQEGSDGNG